MVGRRTKLVGQLVKIGRQNEVTFGVAEHQHQAEYLETQEEHQYTRIGQGRHDHWQRYIEHHLQRRSARHTRRFFHIGTEALQRGRCIQIYVRHMREARNDHDAGKGVDIPGHKTNQVLHPGGVEAHWPHRYDVTETQHHRRHEDRHQQQRRNPGTPRQIGAHHDEGQHAAQRNGDECKPRCQLQAIPERLCKFRIFGDEAVGIEAGGGHRHEERR
jgi:hypothetical protein